MLHDLGVFMDERLALSAVRKHEFNLGLRFDVGGKTGPARANHTHFAELGGLHTCQV